MFRMPQRTFAILAAMTGGATAVALASCSPADSPSGQGPAGAPGVSGNASGGSAGTPSLPVGGAPPATGTAGGGTVGTSGAPAAGAAGMGVAGVGNTPPDGGTGGSGGMGFGGSGGGAIAGSGTAGSGTAGSGTAGSGTAGSGTAGSGTAGSGTAGSGTAGSGGGNSEALAKFSFFVTSIQAITQLAGSEKGFGGDLRFGKADGLSGADEICRQTAELGLAGAGNKQWRAFLSAAGPPVVNARDRIGPGPWHDVRGRLLAQDLTGLLGQDRPNGSPEIVNDLPNERGEPNQYVGISGYTPGTRVDNHDFLTGSNRDGTLYTPSTGGGPPGGGGGMTGGKNSTCQDWTSSEATGGLPRLGHAWPRSKSTGMGAGFASDHDARGCTAGVYLSFDSPSGSGTCVGCGGGYGGLYCFALP